MAHNIIIKTLFTCINIGNQIPEDVFKLRTSGAVGRWAESQLQSSLLLNPNKGADIINMGSKIEIKTRLETTSSALTITSTTLSRFALTPYEQTSFFDKTQFLYLISYNTRAVITNVAVYNWTYEEIQNLLKTSYETLQQRILSGDTENLQSGVVILEISGNRVNVRITNAGLHMIQHLSVDLERPTFDHVSSSRPTGVVDTKNAKSRVNGVHFNRLFNTITDYE